MRLLKGKLHVVAYFSQQYSDAQLGCLTMHKEQLRGCNAACRAIIELKMRGYVKGGQQVAIVQSGRQPIWRSSSTHTIQVINL